MILDYARNPKINGSYYCDGQLGIFVYPIYHYFILPDYTLKDDKQIMLINLQLNTNGHCVQEKMINEIKEITKDIICTH